MESIHGEQYNLTFRSKFNLQIKHCTICQDECHYFRIFAPLQPLKLEQYDIIGTLNIKCYIQKPQFLCEKCFCDIIVNEQYNQIVAEEEAKANQWIQQAQIKFNKDLEEIQLRAQREKQYEVLDLITKYEKQKLERSKRDRYVQNLVQSLRLEELQQYLFTLEDFLKNYSQVQNSNPHLENSEQNENSLDLVNLQSQVDNLDNSLEIESEREESPQMKFIVDLISENCIDTIKNSVKTIVDKYNQKLQQEIIKSENEQNQLQSMKSQFIDLCKSMQALCAVNVPKFQDFILDNIKEKQLNEKKELKERLAVIYSRFQSEYQA